MEKPGNAATCPLCNKSALESTYRVDEEGQPIPHVWFECNRCGSFTMPKRVTLMYKDRVPEVHLLSGFVRESNEKGDDRVLLTDKNMPEFKKLAPRVVAEKASRILRAIAHRTRYPGESISFPLENSYPLGYCVNVPEILHFLHHLEKLGLIKLEVTSMSCDVALTVPGWANVEAQKDANATSTKVFVAMAFDKVMDPTYDEAIAPAIAACGYRPVRIDQEHFTGPISDEIIGHIRESRFVVADMTLHKGGMYFEGGYAMGRGLPVIWTCRKSDVETVHFDTRHYNHLTWETNEELRTALEARIRATIGLAPGTEPKD